MKWQNQKDQKDRKDQRNTFTTYCCMLSFILVAMSRSWVKVPPSQGQGAFSTVWRATHRTSGQARSHCQKSVGVFLDLHLLLSMVARSTISSVLLLVAMPGAPSAALAPSSKDRSPERSVRSGSASALDGLGLHSSVSPGRCEPSRRLTPLTCLQGKLPMRHVAGPAIFAVRGICSFQTFQKAYFLY